MTMRVMAGGVMAMWRSVGSRRRAWAGAMAVVFAGGALAGCSHETQHSVTYSVSVTPGPGNLTFPVKSIQTYYQVGNGSQQFSEVDGDTPMPWSKTMTFRGSGEVTGLGVVAQFATNDSLSVTVMPQVTCQITLDGTSILTRTVGGSATCDAREDLIKQQLGK